MTDPFLWLEELESEAALAWVHKQNRETLATWGRSSRFQNMNEQALQIISLKNRLTMGQVYRGQVYHLWKDEKNPIGVWQRASLDSLSNDPRWEILLDLDQYSVAQGQATFLNSVRFLNGSSRVLLFLSPNGKDAGRMREWDLEKNEFVQAGFSTGLSKDHLDWVDENHILWSSTEVPTHCGYTSKIYSCKRGSAPKLILQVPPSSMSVWGTVFTVNQSDLSAGPHGGVGSGGGLEGNRSGRGPEGDQSVSALDDDRKTAGSLQPKFGPQVYIGHSLSWDIVDLFYWNGDELFPTGLPATARLAGFFQGRAVIWLDKGWQKFDEGSVLIAHDNAKRFGFQSTDFKVLFEATNSETVQDLTIAEEEIAIFYSSQLKNKIRLFGRSGQALETEIPVGSTVGGLFTSVEGRRIFTSFQSFTEPQGWYTWQDSQWKVIQKSPPQFSAEHVASLQEWATSKDGTKIPYWVVHDKRFQFPRPTLQLGYGGFQSSLFPTYSPINGALWIEGGGIFVLAQIRGGAEFGVSWHEAAKLEKKQNSYDDFIAVSEDLIRKGYTTPQQLAIRGRSNGGLLVGATVTQRPDLYGAALIEVPLLDMIRYVELPPGSSWIGEYGDPRDPHFREIIAKYSPYQNVERHSKYPAILIRTARSDDRVHPGHARKMAAKLQSLGHACWFLEEELGGHGSTPVKDQALQHALVFEFLLQNLT